jgi:L-2,4-diaminobutyrate decarboxylase
VRGIELADSVVIDFHKMLLTPAIASGLIFRRGADAFQTFAQEADYLWVADQSECDDSAAYNLAKRTMECTKQMMGLKFFALWQCLGVKTFTAHIDRVFALANCFAELITQADDFELAIQPQANIVCFRYRVAGIAGDPLSELNAAVRKRLIESGEFYIVQTRLNGQLWLRTTISNPFTEPGDLAALLEAIRKQAQAIKQVKQPLEH